MREDKVLLKLNEFLDNHMPSGAPRYLDDSEKLEKYGLQSLNSTKSILQDVYSYNPPSGGGFLRQIKNKIINLIKNVAISTFELMAIRQHKFNELTYQFISHLMEENAKLKREIEQLKQNSK